jgi:Fe2+ transport system protein B
MIFALAGNQNCGKTTLFNALTGSNQHVGNFPGVTVDQKMGEIRGQKNCSVVDLPGIYSLRPYTQEEIVSRDFILGQRPDGIINIVAARRHHQHRGRHEYRAEPLSDAPASGAESAHVHTGAESQKDSVRTSAVALISGCAAHPKRKLLFVQLTLLSIAKSRSE